MTEPTDLFDVAAEGVVLRVHAQPAAGRSAVVGRHGTALKVKVGAPPVDGRANAAIAELLARELGVAPSDVVLRSGDASRSKRFLLRGAEPDAIAGALERLLDRARRGGDRGPAR